MLYDDEISSINSKYWDYIQNETVFLKNYLNEQHISLGNLNG